MAVVIRLTRQGRRNLAYYRVVVTDHEMKRDGRNLEVVGTLNTLTDPPTFSLKEERIRYWVGTGAKPSDTVSQLINKQIPGWLEELEKTRREKIRAKRAKRKAKAKSSGKPKKEAAPKKAAKKAAKKTA